MGKRGRQIRRSAGQRLIVIGGGAILVLGLLFGASLRMEQKAAVPAPAAEPVIRAEGPAQEPEPEDLMTPEEKLAAIEAGGDYPKKLVQMARGNAEAIDFVYQYPHRKGERTKKIDLREDMKQEGVPLLMQWDERWGYQEYGDGPMGYTGCGPTCLSMASVYLTGRDKWNPARVADMAVEQGYMLQNHGSSWKLISEGCEHVGLRAEALPLVCGAMVDALDRGELIILALGPGDFTGSGHFVLVTGYETDGFRIHDPNRRKNSEKLWGFSQLKGQIRNIWAMSAL